MIHIENKEVADYKGDYEYYLSRNEHESKFMAAKEKRTKRIEGGKERLTKAQERIRDK